MIIRTKPGAESEKGSAAEGLQELKSAFLKSREQTERLERVIRLCETARAAADRRALGYTALNDTLAAIDYRQAALWWRAAVAHHMDAGNRFHFCLLRCRRQAAVHLRRPQLHRNGVQRDRAGADRAGLCRAECAELTEQKRPSEAF